MPTYEFTVNGKTFTSDKRAVDAAVLLREAFCGQAIGMDPDRTGFVLRAADSGETFVAGQVVELNLCSCFRAAPEKGAPFA